MTEAAARARIADWLSPISDASPAGEDARYDPAHESVRAEAGKLEDPGAGMPQWDVLLQGAESLTKTKSKDLLIEAYAAYALYQLEGLGGLAAGMFLLAESMDKYWDTMQPPAARIRARVNAVAWLTARLEVVLPETAVDGGDRDAVAALDAGFSRLRSVINDKFTDQAPPLGPISDAIARIKLSLPAGGGASPSAPAAPPSAPAAAPPTADPAPPSEAGAPPPAADPAAAAPAPAAPPAPAKDDPLAWLAERAKPFVEPIPGDTAVGIDAKYDPAHEALRNDIAALDSPTGGHVEWSDVATRSGDLLKATSKDLLIASYLAYARFETDRFEGLAVGLEVITQICEKYWDDCFPPVQRLRGRANALTWMLERLEAPLGALTPTASDRVAVDRLDASAKRFAGVVRDKFEDAAPSLRPFTETIQRVKMSVPAPKPAAPPPSAAAPAAPARPAPAAPKADVALAAPSGSLADAAQLGPFTKQITMSLLDAAKVLRDAAPKDPASYGFVRLGAAIGAKPPPIAKGNETRARVPPDTIMRNLNGHFEAQRWTQLLGEAETELGTKPFWWDLHRYSAIALTNLGGEYASALQAAIAGSAYWALAFPETIDQTFTGGVPFASEATKDWVRAEVLPQKGGGGGGGSDELGEARALVAGGKVDEALAMLGQIAGSATSGRARFSAKLAIAQALANGSTAPAADGIFEGLAAEIDAVGLERWEPELAAACYRGHVAVLKQLKKDPAGADRLAVVFRRLCRVDPVGASKTGL
ncbi:MAG: type VI secretion system protein TssA [Sandaracinaceae bacterium]